MKTNDEQRDYKSQPRRSQKQTLLGPRRCALGNIVDDFNYRIERAEHDIKLLPNKTLREMHALRSLSFEAKCKSWTWVPYVWVSPVAMAVIEMMITNEIETRAKRKESA